MSVITSTEQPIARYTGDEGTWALQHVRTLSRLILVSLVLLRHWNLDESASMHRALSLRAGQTIRDAC